MMDALAGRDKHGVLTLSSSSPLVRTAFAIQTSYAEWAVFCAAVFTHIVLAFIEDTYRIPAIVLTVPCLSVFIGDIFMKMLYMTPKDYIGKVWNATQVG